MSDVIQLPPVPHAIQDAYTKRWLEQARDFLIRFAATKFDLIERTETMASIKSEGNSSTDALGVSETFTGTAEINGFDNVLVTCKSDVAGTLYADFSPDGLNWDSTLTYAVAADTFEIHRLVKGARYFRVRYTNGSVAQTYMRLHVSYGDFGPLTTPRNLAASADIDTLVTRPTDYGLDVSSNEWSGVKAVRKFGFNPVVGTTEEDIWGTGGTYTGWLTSASTVEAISSSTNDSSSGTGARKLTIVGLDENFDEAEETVDLDGTSPSGATTTRFIRVNRAFVPEGGAGTYHGTNIGNLTVRVSSAGATLAQIVAARGQTELAMYTVPAGYTAHIKSIQFNVEGSKPASCYFYQYPAADDVTVPFSGKRLIMRAPGVDGQYDHEFTQYVRVTEKTDLWCAADVAATSASVAAEFELFLVAN